MSSETPAPNPAETITEPAEPPRSWWRYSLGAIFVLTAVVAIGMAWWVNGPLRQARAIAEIRALGGSVNPQYEISWSMPEPEPWLPRDYFGEINQVDLSNCQKGSAALRAVGQLSKIGYLNLTAAKINDDDLQQLAGLEIGSLWLNETAIGDQGLKAITAVRKIETLYLVGTRVTNSGMAHVAEHTGLYNLNIAKTDIGDAGLAALRRMPQLQYLQLDNTKTTDAGLAHLAGLKKLVTLDLSHDFVGDEGLRHLAGLTNLTELYLTETSISDDGLVHLAGLSKLQYLSLKISRIRGPGLDHFATLQVLKCLMLASTQIHDDDLLRLRPLQALRSVDIEQTWVTQDGIDRAAHDPELKRVQFTGTPQPSSNKK